MNERTCIVTRRTLAPEEMIRFVAAPDGTVVPDLKRNFPGRGCWVSARRADVDRAAAKGLFSRALRAPAKADPGLGDLIDRLLAKAALGALGLARKAGAVALGAAKTDAAVRGGKAAATLHAFEAAEDGLRKLDAARRFVVHAGGGEVPAYRLFSEAELSLALGGANVIHAAVLRRDAGMAALKRMRALERFRGDDPAAGCTIAASAAEDTE